jgi:hypothetical protein
MTVTFYDLCGVRAELETCTATAMQTDTQHGWYVTVHVGHIGGQLGIVFENTQREFMPHDILLQLANKHVHAFHGDSPHHLQCDAAGMYSPQSMPVLGSSPQSSTPVAATEKDTAITQETLDMLQLILLQGASSPLHATQC